jgi:predicted RNA-binding Zn-ribbon protein involved in translation (DUF1610 family)
MKKIKDVLKCKNCGYVWRYEDKKTITKCPLCDKTKHTRDRKAYSKDYMERHPERKDKLKDWLSQHSKEHSDKTSAMLKRSVFALISKSPNPKCVSCGCDDLRLLEVNHKDGGGGKELNKGKNSMRFYRDIAMLRRGTEDLEILCRVCNAKHYLETKFGKLPIEVTWRGKC